MALDVLIRMVFDDKLNKGKSEVRINLLIVY